MAASGVLKGTALFLAGLAGYGLVALVWMRWQPIGEPFWRDDGMTAMQAVASPGGRYQARLGLRSRSELALTGGTHERIPVVSVSDGKRRREETWALFSAPAHNVKLSWDDEAHLTVTATDPAFHLTLALDGPR